MDIKLSKDYTGSRDGAPRKIRRVALKLDKFPLEIWRSGKKVQPPKGFRLQKGIYYTPGSVFPAEVDRISEDLSIQGLTVAVCTGPIHAGRGASYKIYAWKEKGMKETKSKGIRWSVQDQKDGICPICHDGDMGEDYDDDGHRYLYHTQCDFYSYEWEELTGNTLEEKSMKEAAGKYRLRITTWQEDQLKRKNIVFNAKDEKMGGLKALTIAALGGEKLSNVPKEEMLEIMTEIESDMERYGFSAADYAAQMYGEELTMRLISPTGEVLINSDSEDDEAEEDYDESVEARIDRLTEKELEVVEQRLGIKRESSGDEYQLLLSISYYLIIRQLAEQVNLLRKS